MPDVTEWVWVKDLSTGHLYDIPAVFLGEDGTYPGVQVIAARPRHFGPNPRPAKHHISFASESRTDETTAASAAGADAASAASTNEE